MKTMRSMTSEYAEGDEDFEIDPPMHEIKKERDRTLNQPNNNHRVNLRKYRGRGWSSGCKEKEAYQNRKIWIQ